MTPFLPIYIVNEIPRLRATVFLIYTVAFGHKILLKTLFKFLASLERGNEMQPVT